MITSHSYERLVKAESELAKYESPKLGISLQYPAEWELTGDSTTHKFDCFRSGVCTVGLKLGGLVDYLTIHLDVIKLTRCDCSTLKEYVTWDYLRQDQMNKNLGLYHVLINDNQTKIDSNHDAWQIEQEVEISSEMYKDYIVWAINGDLGYHFSYNGKEELFMDHLDQFKQILNSVEFIPVDQPKLPSFLTGK